MNNAQSLEELSLHSLQDIYSAEQQALKAMPELMAAVSSPELKQAFAKHQQETQQQVQRLEQLFQIMGEKPGNVTCKAMQGLIAEAQEMIEMKGDPAVRDAGIIAAAQKQEHYEIAAYGTAVTWAKLLGQNEAASLLAQTLDEEEKTDKNLTKLAERTINARAASK